MLGPKPLPKLAHEARLADAGLARDQDHLAESVGHTRREPPKRGHLLVAADVAGADDGCIEPRGHCSMPPGLPAALDERLVRQVPCARSRSPADRYMRAYGYETTAFKSNTRRPNGSG